MSTQYPADMPLKLFRRCHNVGNGNLIHSLLDFVENECGRPTMGLYSMDDVRAMKMPLFFHYASYLTFVELAEVQSVFEKKSEVKIICNSLN
jgi:hypothetical protein